ncbi:MAG TPA: nitrogenase-stabilizing/protective protein NifW [Rhodocyclaceae bacterium]
MNAHEDLDLASDLEDLVSAEDFLNYFDVPYDPQVVHVNRLHILQRFHDYLSKQAAGQAPEFETYKAWLARAYEDFVNSNSLNERVFAVLQKAAGTSFVSLDQVQR